MVDHVAKKVVVVVVWVVILSQGDKDSQGTTERSERHAVEGRGRCDPEHTYKRTELAVFKNQRGGKLRKTLHTVTLYLGCPAVRQDRGLVDQRRNRPVEVRHPTSLSQLLSEAAKNCCGFLERSLSIGVIRRNHLSVGKRQRPTVNSHIYTYLCT